jgi:hypothetical protein
MKILIQNFLVVSGIYWLSMWVFIPVAILHGKITTGIIYEGFLGALLMHIVASLPVAVVSFGGGILCAYIIDKSNKPWILVLAILYIVMGFTGWHYAIQPELSDRFFQLVQSLIPAITCYLGGITATKTIMKKDMNEIT